MIGVIIYLGAILLELAFFIGFTIYILGLIFSSIMGSPYVPTKRKQVELILKNAKFKKGQYLIEIGSGDGRLSTMATKLYGVKALGIDINPMLIKYAKLKARLARATHVQFKRANILHEDLTKADVIYIFLMPELIKKLEPQLSHLRKKTLVISHGFKVPYLEKKKIQTIEQRPFPTYFYKI